MRTRINKPVVDSELTVRAKQAACGLSVLLAALSVPGVARAEPPFPEAIQQAAGLECTPQCTLCHTDPNGGPNWANKKVGIAIGTNGVHKGSSGDDVKKAYAAIEAKAKMGDPAAALVVNSLTASKDPDTGEAICQITYGCGAHVAKTTPRDDWSGLLFVAGAMLFGAILRRGKARSAAG